ncbi:MULTISPECIES: hypothetical protein [unclassified Phenylobacterium]|uniref:hypothetical protein n=1 Tax=unclassified Phenylobacterium TaxID=2640670 RepID=UPI00083AFC4C|nr:MULTISPECIES: hypothetical protein [unclassified Phenylobacterium]
MAMLVDASRFPVGLDIDYESPEEIEGLRRLQLEAREFVENDSSRPISDLVLAFGIAPILALFLVRFERPRKPEDAERWAVVGNLPAMHFETDDTPTPALALQLYCAIAQDWADNVLEGRDLSENYPIEAAPTREHAEMLLDRIDFIRRELIPRAAVSRRDPHGDV